MGIEFEGVSNLDQPDLGANRNSIFEAEISVGCYSMFVFVSLDRFVGKSLAAE